MKSKNLILLVFFTLTFLLHPVVYAQNDVNIWAAQPFHIDGRSDEWHEPLNNYNSETKLAFALANDQNNLYLIIESLDAETTRKLLSGGLTLNINTDGKKKDGLKLIFLGMNKPPHQKDSLSLHKNIDENGGREHHDSLAQSGPESRIEFGSQVSQDGEQEGRKPGLRMIQVSGFKTIPAGGLAIPNPHGIQVAAAFNTQKDYICELAIPMSLLDFKGKTPRAIAYNIKINTGGFPGKGSMEGGHRPPGGGGGMGGMGGGDMGGGQRPPGGGGGPGGHGGPGGGGMGGPGTTETKSDFWIKYELAKPTATFRAN